MKYGRMSSCHILSEMIDCFYDSITASDSRRRSQKNRQNTQRCRFLKEARRSAAIPVVTAHAGIPQTPRAKRQEELTQTAFALYTLCLPSPHPSDAFLRCSSLIRKTE